MAAAAMPLDELEPWLTARAKTEENGPIVASISNSFLTPTGFSSVK